MKVVNQRLKRVDGKDKVIGLAAYTADIPIEGALIAKIATSKYAHAEIIEVNINEAKCIPGVIDIILPKDLPGENQIGEIIPDQPLLAEKKVRMTSDRIAVVVAQNEEAAEKAINKINVIYRQLPAVYDVFEALKKDAPKIHESGNLQSQKTIVKGDIESALKNADHIIENTYFTNYQEHAYLETNHTIAIPHSDGTITVVGSYQCPFYVQKHVARILNIPLSFVRVQQKVTGGGFGGKEDYPSELAACAAVAAVRTGKPVKLFLTREEDIKWSTKRHPVHVKAKHAVTKEGKLLGIDLELYFDAGGYAGMSPVVAERGNSSAIGPYEVDNVRVKTFTVYTNNLFTGPYRGFGAPQATFAHEAQMDAIAVALKMSPKKIREKNLLTKKSTTCTGQTVKDSFGLKDVFKSAIETSEFDKKYKEINLFNKTSKDIKKGIGMSTIIYGVGLHAGGQRHEGSGSLIIAHTDGSFSLFIGGTDMGQGAFTMAAQIAAETLGVPIDAIRVQQVDTNMVQDSGPTVASRTTWMSGNAALDAARSLKKHLMKRAEIYFGAKAKDIIFEEGIIKLKDNSKSLGYKELIKIAYEAKDKLSETGWYAPGWKTFDFSSGKGEAYTVYAYGMHVAEVEVCLLTGATRVINYTAVHDVGTSINPLSLEGQIEGGAVQGMGWALFENMKLKEGHVITPNFTTYTIPTSMDIPDIKVRLIEAPFKQGPFGAKGVGEPALIPAAGAVGNAISHAIGKRVTKIPANPEYILELINGNETVVEAEKVES